MVEKISVLIHALIDIRQARGISDLLNLDTVVLVFVGHTVNM